MFICLALLLLYNQIFRLQKMKNIETLLMLILAFNGFGLGL